MEIKKEENKVRRLNVRLDEKTYTHFETLSKVTGVPKSEIVRGWIEQAYSELKVPGEFVKPAVYAPDHAITPAEAIREHKRFWDAWPYFSEPRRVWHDEKGQLCIEYVEKADLSTHFYRYTIENGNIVWG